jgi:hypothetical protein
LKQDLYILLTENHATLRSSHLKTFTQILLLIFGGVPGRLLVIPFSFSEELGAEIPTGRVVILINDGMVLCEVGFTFDGL